MARPSKYDTEVKPFLKEIQQAVEAGATNEEIAEAFGISLTSIYKYKKEKKEFADAFTRGREKVVIQIKAALLKKALGFEYEEEKKVGRKDKDGEQIILIEKYKRYSVPSETAAAMLLRNYDSDWRDTDTVSADLRRQEMQLRKAIAESNNFDLDLGDEKK